MTVKELIEALGKLDPDRRVMVSCDAEGNSHAFLEEIDDVSFITERDDVRCITWTPEDACEEPDEWEEIKVRGERVVMLWPEHRYY